MTVHHRHPAGRANLVGIIVGGVLTVVGGVPMLYFGFLALRARLGPASADRHGYVMIFGTMFALMCAVPTIIGLPLLIGGVRHRRRCARDGRNFGDWPKPR